MSCTTKEDKIIIETVNNTFKAASEGNIEEFIKHAPFIAEYEESQYPMFIYAFAQLDAIKDKVSVVSKDSDDDIRVKISFISDFEPIILICYKENDQYYLTDTIIETQEYDYIEPEQE